MLLFLKLVLRMRVLFGWLIENDWLRGYESENSKGKSKESGGIGVPWMLDGNKIPSDFKNDLVGIRTSLCLVAFQIC